MTTNQREQLSSGLSDILCNLVLYSTCALKITMITMYTPITDGTTWTIR